MNEEEEEEGRKKEGKKKFKNQYYFWLERNLSIWFIGEIGEVAWTSVQCDHPLKKNIHFVFVSQFEFLESIEFRRHPNEMFHLTFGTGKKESISEFQKIFWVLSWNEKLQLIEIEPGYSLFGSIGFSWIRLNRAAKSSKTTSLISISGIDFSLNSPLNRVLK